MSQFYKEGEVKIRPGVYQRYENIGLDTLVYAQDGICAIPVRASWGPLGKVLKNNRPADLKKNYGSGTYSTAYTVPAAEAMFIGGAITVYTYRLGTGGKKASKEMDGLTVTAKYEGTMPISVAVQEKLADPTKKQFMVYAQNALVESIDFEADGKQEGANLIAAVSKKSKYVDITGTAVAVSVLAVASGALSGGEDPTVTNENYSTAFEALEPYYYNTIALDIDDDEDMTLSLMLDAYLDDAYEMGKLGIAVVGEKTTVDFETRLAHAKAFDDYKVVYLGNGYMAGNVNKEGVMAICYTAGLIAATPSNRGITHTAVAGATDLCESLTYHQYEEAILNGMLLLDRSPDGEIWYDSAINTFTSEPDELNDEGWRKIRRTKVRFEMFDRIDRALAPKVGKITADSDGIADVVQTGQRVIDAMAKDEGKLFAGATFKEDPDHPFEGDSGWFIITADDKDSLEKIYDRFQFRYSQYSGTI